MRLFEGTPFDRPPTCDRCGALESDCTCSPPPPPAPQWKAPEKQTARVTMEKRKKGKRVTVVHGLAAADNDLPQLLTQLKNRCGAGGTIRDDTLEIQGNHMERVRDALREIGYRV